jgi:hypothetical protein
MERFLIVYRSAPGGATETTTHDPQRWASWFDSLGSALIDRGSVTHGSVEITTRLAGPKPIDSSLAGYSLVEAPDFNAAVHIAEQCPIFDEHGFVEIARLTGTPS